MKKIEIFKEFNENYGSLMELTDFRIHKKNEEIKSLQVQLEALQREKMYLLHIGILTKELADK